MRSKQKFFLVRDNVWGPVLWVTKVGEDSQLDADYVDPDGCEYDKDEVTVLEEVEAYSFKDMDYFKTSYVAKWDPEEGIDSGWLDRRGVLYGCDSMGHLDMARYIFGEREISIEMAGWVKISRGEIIPSGYKAREQGKVLRMTKAQERWLVHHELDPELAGFS